MHITSPYYRQSWVIDETWIGLLFCCKAFSSPCFLFCGRMCLLMSFVPLSPGQWKAFSGRKEWESCTDGMFDILPFHLYARPLFLFWHMMSANNAEELVVVVMPQSSLVTTFEYQQDYTQIICKWANVNMNEEKWEGRGKERCGNLGKKPVRQSTEQTDNIYYFLWLFAKKVKSNKYNIHWGSMYLRGVCFGNENRSDKILLGGVVLSICMLLSLYQSFALVITCVRFMEKSFLTKLQLEGWCSGVGWIYMGFYRKHFPLSFLT